MSIVGSLAPKFSIMANYPEAVARPAAEKFVQSMLASNIKEFEAPLIELSHKAMEEGQEPQEQPKWILDVVADLDRDAPADMQKWKVVRIKVAPCKQLMKKYEMYLDIEKKLHKLLKKIGPHCADARQLVQQNEESWKMLLMAVKTLGGCVVTQVCTKKLHGQQTRAGELLLVTKFWKDAQVEMPQKFVPVIENAS